MGNIQRAITHSLPVAFLVLAACSGGMQKSTASRTAHTSTAAPAGDPYGGDSAASAEAAPAERPGLGTVFGEHRHSRIEHRTFERATVDPFAVVALHYNDAEGVAAHAHYRGGSPAPVFAHTPAGGISVALRDASGQVLPGAPVGDRTLVVGRAGERYDIEIRNDTGGRFEIVASVDGLDVIDGEPASPGKRGYILDPHSTLVIDGFRTSADSVAAFRFGRVADSYAARTAGDRNVGVIGVALFAERGSVWTTDELHQRDTADPFPGRYAQPPG